MKIYKTAVGNLPKPLQIFLSANISFGGRKFDLKRNIKVIEAANIEEFNNISSKFGAFAQRIKQTKPFVRFYFISFHMPEVNEAGELQDYPTLIFLDLKADGISFAKYGDTKIIEPTDLT